MKIKELIQLLQKAQEIHGDKIEVEVHWQTYGTTTTIEGVSYVHEYNLKYASKSAPTILLKVNED